MNPPVYILHGWAYDLTKWQPLLDALKAKGINATLLPVPGLTAPIDRAWDINDYVEWFNQQIGDAPAIIIGHSNGGRIALNFAVRYPEKVKQLILIDSAGIPDERLLNQLKLGVLKLIAKVGKRLTKNPTARKALYKLAGARDYGDANPVMRETMSKLLDSDYTLEPAQVKAPTVLIWGKQDTITPLRDAHALQKALTNAPLKLVEEARHSPQFTHTDQVATYISEAIQNGIV